MNGSGGMLRWVCGLVGKMNLLGQNYFRHRTLLT
jgi:hypothetical protein